jgi:hypothetical protein
MLRLSRFLLPSVLVGVLALVSAGCGSDDDAAPSSTKAAGRTDADVTAELLEQLPATTQGVAVLHASPERIDTGIATLGRFAAWDVLASQLAWSDGESARSALLTQLEGVVEAPVSKLDEHAGDTMMLAPLQRGNVTIEVLLLERAGDLSEAQLQALLGESGDSLIVRDDVIIVADSDPSDVVAADGAANLADEEPLMDVLAVAQEAPGAALMGALRTATLTAAGVDVGGATTDWVAASAGIDKAGAALRVAWSGDAAPDASESVRSLVESAGSDSSLAVAADLDEQSTARAADAMRALAGQLQQLARSEGGFAAGAGAAAAALMRDAATVLDSQTVQPVSVAARHTWLTTTPITQGGAGDQLSDASLYTETLESIDAPDADAATVWGWVDVRAVVGALLSAGEGSASARTRITPTVVSNLADAPGLIVWRTSIEGPSGTMMGVADARIPITE